MMKISFLIILIFLFFINPVLSFAQDEDICKSLDIAKVSCDQNTGLFKLQYDQENDDFFSQPNLLPKICHLEKSKYRISGIRGPYSERRCGAEPPVSIALTRNGKALVSDAVFGGNCFGGRSIAGIEITEKRGKIIKIKLCAFNEGKSPVAEGDNYEPTCKIFSGEKEIKKILPISQMNIDDIFSDKNR